jgi:aminopeptidase N
MRDQVGDETFIQILQTYFRQHRYGIAYPQDFLSAAEDVSGQDMTALYRQWIAGQN